MVDYRNPDPVPRLVVQAWMLTAWVAGIQALPCLPDWTKSLADEITLLLHQKLQKNNRHLLARLEFEATINHPQNLRRSLFVSE